MGYDRGDSFPFDFEPNGIIFGSKSKGKLSPRSYAIQFEKKWKYSFLSVAKIVLIFNKKKLKNLNMELILFSKSKFEITVEIFTTTLIPKLISVSKIDQLLSHFIY